MARGVYDRNKDDQVYVTQDIPTDEIVGIEPEAVNPQTVALEKENERLKAQLTASKAAKGIPMAKSAQVQGEDIKRAEAIMSETLPVALSKQPKELDDADKISIEREIRRFVKRGGVRKDEMGQFKKIECGYVKNITPAQKQYVDALLAKMGRKTVEWDINIVVPGFRNV